MVGSAYSSVDTSFKPTQYIPQYQGVPIKEMMDTSKILQDRYDTAINQYDSLHELANQIQVPEEELEVKEGAINKIRGIIGSVAENEGAWEKSQPILRKAAREFVSNEDLRTSQYNFGKQQEYNKILQEYGPDALAFKTPTFNQRDEKGRLKRVDFEVEKQLRHLDQKLRLASVINPDKWDVMKIENGKKIVDKAKLNLLNTTTFKDNPLTEEDINNITLLRDGAVQSISPTKIKSLGDKLLNSYKSTAEYQQELRMRQTGVGQYGLSENPDEDIKQSLMDVAGLRVYRQEDLRTQFMPRDEFDRLAGRKTKEESINEFISQTLSDPANPNSQITQNVPLANKTVKDSKSTKNFEQQYNDNLNNVKKINNTISKGGLGINSYTGSAIAPLLNLTAPIVSLFQSMLTNPKTEDMTIEEKQNYDFAESWLDYNNENFKELQGDQKEESVNKFINETNKTLGASVVVQTADPGNPDINKQFKSFDENMFKQVGSGDKMYIAPRLSKNLTIYDVENKNKTQTVKKIFDDEVIVSAETVGMISWDNPFGMPSGYQVELINKKGEDKTIFMSNSLDSYTQEEIFLNSAANAKYQEGSGISDAPFISGNNKIVPFIQYDPIKKDRFFSVIINDKNMKDSLKVYEKEANKYGLKGEQGLYQVLKKNNLL